MTKITPLDVNWCNRPKSIAAALLESENHVALIDPGPESTLTTLREQLSNHGLAISDLNAILLTHIHLDHAGASGKLVRENPKLKVFVHSKGAKHMVDPAKLVASATRLWGDQLPVLFGEKEGKIARAVLSGGTARVPALFKTIEARAGVPVEILNPFKNIEIDNKRFDPAVLLQAAPAAAVGVGLALRRPGDK